MERERVGITRGEVKSTFSVSIPDRAQYSICHRLLLFEIPITIANLVSATQFLCFIVCYLQLKGYPYLCEESNLYTCGVSLSLGSQHTSSLFKSQNIGHFQIEVLVNDKCLSRQHITHF